MPAAGGTELIRIAECLQESIERNICEAVLEEAKVRDIGPSKELTLDLSSSPATIPVLSAFIQT